MADADDTTFDLTISEDLAPLPEQQAASTTALDFDGLLLPQGPLKLRQDLRGGNGGRAWVAGMVLARYLLRRKRDELRDKTILELGAGGGLVGLAVALGCQPTKPVRITDQAPMLPLMQQNIALNLLETRVAASVLDWGSSSSSQLHLDPTLNPPDGYPDVILAADCVYFEPAFPLLRQALRELMGPRTVCYFCFKKRRRADGGFMGKVRKGFVVEEVVDDPDRETYSRENVFLYRITAKVAK